MSNRRYISGSVQASRTRTGDLLGAIRAKCHGLSRVWLGQAIRGCFRFVAFSQFGRRIGRSGSRTPEDRFGRFGADRRRTGFPLVVSV
jgi:hypothetical protein